MIKSLINKSVKAALKELFIEGGNFHVSMGADLFSESTIHLKDLVFRPDIFDVCLQPLRLISGHLGKLSVEGIAELALGGGTVRCQAENIFLLFNVDTAASAEQVLFMKKLLLELQGGTISQIIIRELLTRILGIPGAKAADAIKKRKLLLRGLNYIFKSLIFTVNNVHIRIEIANAGAGNNNNTSGGNKNSYSAVGITLPQLRFAPQAGKAKSGSAGSASNSSAASGTGGGSAGGGGGGGKEEPSLSLSIKSLQVYCDYDCESYVVNGDKSPAAVLRQFIDRWKSELHTAFLLPFDIEVLFSAEVRSKSGLITPKFSISVPKLRTACDPRQLQVLKQLVELLVLSSKRMQQLVKISEVYSTSRLPVIIQSGGTHLLPYMSYGNSQYPQQMGLPRSDTPSVVKLMKQLHKGEWARATWRFAANLIIDDIRSTKPVHRWIDLAKLARIRKEYAFLYGRLLKRSKETGNFVYNVNARLDPAAMSKLYAYEMMLPIPVIQCFRTLAVMVAMVDRFNVARARGSSQPQQSSTAGGAGGAGSQLPPLSSSSSLSLSDGHATTSSSGVSLRWRDILKIYSETIEARRQTVFNKNTHVGVDDVDDSVSVYSDGTTIRGGGYSDGTTIRGGGGGSASESPRERGAGDHSNHFNNPNTGSRSSTPLTVPHTPLPVQQHAPPVLAPAPVKPQPQQQKKNVPQASSSGGGMFSSLFGPDTTTTTASNSNSSKPPPSQRPSGPSSSTDITTSTTSGGSGGGSLLHRAANPLSAASMMKNAATATMDKMAKAVAAAPTQAVKMMLGGMADITGIQFDEMDTKIIGRAELAAFGELFGKTEPEERAGEEVAQGSGGSGGGGVTADSVHGSSSSSSVHGGLLQQQGGGLCTDTSLLHVDVLAKLARYESPSTAAIRDAVQWGMTRHRRALIMKVPDFSLVVDAVDISLRLPLESGSRKNVLHAKLEKVGLNLVISHMGGGGGGGGGGSSSGTADNGLAGGSGLAGGQSGSGLAGGGIVQMSNGFASLDGSLIQMRVSVDEYAIAVSVNTNTTTATNSDSIDGYDDDVLKVSTRGNHNDSSKSDVIKAIGNDDIGGSSSYHTGPPSSIPPTTAAGDTASGPAAVSELELMAGLQNFDIFAPYEGPVIHEIDGLDVFRPFDGTVDKTSTSAATPATNVRQKSVGNAATTRFADSTIKARTEAKIKAIPAGGTVLTAERLRQQQEMDAPKPSSSSSNQQQLLLQQQQRLRLAAEEDPTIDWKTVDLKTLAAKKRKSAFSDDPTAVEVLYSERSAQAAIFCVILDVNADKDKGAADFQVALGGLHIAAGDFALANLFDPSTVACCAQSLEAVVDMEKLAFSSFTSSLVVDRELRLPAILRLHNEQKENKPSSLPGASVSAVYASSVSSATRSVSGKRPTHKAIVNYLNLIQWRSIIEKYVPQVFSVCLRTSEIGADTLTIGSLRELIMTKIRDISDRASPRYYSSSSSSSHSYAASSRYLPRPSSSSYSGGIAAGIEHNASFNVLMMVLEDIRRQSSIDDVAANNTDLHSRAIVPAVEFTLAKSIKPYSCIELSAAGVRILLPLSDETMRYALSTTLSEAVPIYY